MFLLDGACAPSPMATATNMEFRCIRISREFKGVLVELVLNLGVDAFFFCVGFFSAVAPHMGSTSLAQAPAVGALRNGSAFLIDVCKRPVYESIRDHAELVGSRKLLPEC